jgi:hypothetical protein
MTSRLWRADPDVSAVDDLARITTEYLDKYADPHTGAKATIPNEGDTVSRVRVTHVVTWEYGVVATRTDWSCDE